SELPPVVSMSTNAKTGNSVSVGFIEKPSFDSFSSSYINKQRVTICFGR
ncbi:MAG: hypothetical protein ACI87L_001694, partial [Litorivivens sp.]